MFSIIKELRQAGVAPHRKIPFAKIRTLVLDTMAEGRLKNIIHTPFEVDATAILAQIKRINQEHRKRITLTSYVAKILADTVAADTRMQAYRNSHNEMVLFDDVDLSVLVERKVNGERLPLPFILRAANTQGLAAVDEALRNARSVSLFHEDGMLTKLEKYYCSLPDFMRRCVRFFVRRDPNVFRLVSGTVGLSSIPFKFSERVNGIPITPMTLTLFVGVISPVVKLIDGEAVENQVLQMNLSADHDVIDGFQMMRFLQAFRKRLYEGSIAI